VTAAAKAKNRHTARVAAATPRMRDLIEAFLRKPSPRWRDTAACRRAKPTLFIPADRPGKNPQAFEYERDDSANHEAARRYCLACPVIADCLAHALTEEEEGTWGGERFTALDWEAGRAVKKEMEL
jgi:hypothetical protein